MEGWFRVSAYPHGSEHPDDIKFELQPSATGEIPEDQASLKSETEKTLDILRALHPPENKRFLGYFKEILGAAQYGLVGDTAQPVQAMATLRNIQDKIFDLEKGRVISLHMTAIFRAHAAILGSLGLLMAVVALGLWYKQYSEIATLLGKAIVAVFGLFTGALFSSFLRCRAVGFYELAAIDADRFTPSMRCVFSIIILLIAGALLKAGMFEIKIGSVQLSGFDQNVLAAFVFGCVIGVAQEAAISRIETIKSKVAPSQEKRAS